MSSSLIAINALILLAKITVTLGLGALAYRLAARQSSSFRHALLVLGLGLTGLVTACHLLVPGWHVFRFDFAKTASSQNVSKHDSPPQSHVFTSTKRSEVGVAKGRRQRNLRTNAPTHRQPELDSQNPFASSPRDDKVDSKDNVASPSEIVPPLAIETSSPTKTPPLEANDSFDGGFRAVSFEFFIFAGFAVWSVGTIWLLLRLTVALVAIDRVFRRSHSVNKGGLGCADARLTKTWLAIATAEPSHISVSLSKSNTQSPISAGFFRPTILLPATARDWEPDQLRSVLLHESAHLYRCDFLFNLLARFTQALFWFHPWAWWYVNRLNVEAEFACDEMVIRRGVDKRRYAMSLLQVARETRASRLVRLVGMSMSDAVDLEGRVSRVLSIDPRSPVSFGRLALVQLAIFGVLVAVPLAIVKAGLVEVIPVQPLTILATENQVDELEGQSSLSRQSSMLSINWDDGAQKRIDLAGPIVLRSSFGVETLEASDIARIIPSKIRADRLIVEMDSGERLWGAVDGLEIKHLSKGVREIVPVQEASPIAGQITDGRSSAGLTYHVRAPANYRPGNSVPAIVLLHDDASNSRINIETFARSWPSIADRYLLIGINGQLRSPRSTDVTPAYSYSLIDFAGRSKYIGFPGTDRQSPALVAETISEVRSRVDIDRVFLGGEGLGGWVVFSVFMHFPEIIDGAFPISGAVVIQSEPGAFDQPDLMTRQRQIPVALVQSRNDTRLDAGYVKSASSLFKDANFKVESFSIDADSQFSKQPIADVISWLEQSTKAE
ncbi:MAG: M56 family metallopeptidase [Planctomycetota bacterium]